MITEKYLYEIIKNCNQISKKIFNFSTGIPTLKIEILDPPNDFLGTNNPAIFVTEKTHRLINKYYKNNFEINKTIAVRSYFLKTDSINIIGMIIHEIGHAFNVAANLPNTESNAYIFEIEILSYLMDSKNVLLSAYNKNDLEAYFKDRCSNYRIYPNGKHNVYLDKLINKIKEGTLFDYLQQEFKTSSNSNEEKFSQFSIQKIKATKNVTFFDNKMLDNGMNPYHTLLLQY